MLFCSHFVRFYLNCHNAVRTSSVLQLYLFEPKFFSLEGKGRKSKKRKGSQGQYVEGASAVPLESPEHTQRRRDSSGKQSSQTNSGERKTVDASQTDTPRQGRPRSSQQRGRRGGGRQVESTEKPQTGSMQGTNSPARINSAGE